MKRIQKSDDLKLQQSARLPICQIRRGSVLFVVLVVIALLTLASYQFSHIMSTENAASNQYGRRVRARALADSGIETAAAFLGQRQLLTSDTAAEQNLYHNPGLFGGKLLYGSDSSPAGGRGRFSVLSPVENDETAKTVRFGLADESGKLNINTLLTVTGDSEEGREEAVLILLAIPGMTEDIAEAILDWIDEDEETIYLTLEEDLYVGYKPKNGPFESLDELLLLPDVTPFLLFGADANRNGIIDDGESQNAQNMDDDFHPLGWSAFLTVHSRESNKRLDGEEKVNLNEGLLTELYDALEEEFSEDGNAEEIARFVVAYRMNGPNNAEESPPASAGLVTENQSGGTSSRQGSEQLQKLAQGTAKALFSAANNGGQVTRGGMDLSGGAKFKINSFYDLVDAEVTVTVDGSEITLKSPWSSSDLPNYISDVLNRVSTTGDESIKGRINVNQARREVLLAVIGGVEGFSEDVTLAEDLASKIVAAKMIDGDGQPLNGTIANRDTTAWLITDGLVTLEQMRQLDRYLTTRGDVYRAQVIGYYDKGGPISRQEVIIDASQKPPRVIFQRDLTPLGKGFTPSQLGSPGQ
ncbi:MAG: type II secretion system protein GspK [Planctomycetaceae bacterium]